MPALSPVVFLRRLGPLQRLWIRLWSPARRRYEARLAAAIREACQPGSVVVFEEDPPWTRNLPPMAPR